MSDDVCTCEFDPYDDPSEGESWHFRRTRRSQARLEGPMPTGDGDHSFGHSSHCYWCGLDGDDSAIEKPCDERENKKPSKAAMDEVARREAVTHRIEAFFFDYVYGEIDFNTLIERARSCDRATPAPSVSKEKP